MTAKSTSTLDQPWAYGHLSTPAILGVLAWGVAACLHLFDVPTTQVLVAGALLTIVSPLAALGIGSPLSTRWFVGLLFASLTGFLAWTAATTPFQQNAAVPVVLGMILFGAWWRVIAHQATQRDLKAEQAKAEEEKLLARNELAGWIQTVGLRGVEPVGDRIPYPDPTVGYMQDLDLPRNGSVTYTMLVNNVEKIETAARAEFPIRFEKKGSGRVCGHVILRDVLMDTIPYPVDRRSKSIKEPMPLGVDETGTVVTLTMRELSGLIGGTRGSGKSALLNSQLAYLVGCKDALVWMIDGKGGRTARPWLQPFLEGIGKPALDYVAITGEEAGFMLAAARAVIAHRSRGDGEKVDPTPRQPAIILIIEEASLVTRHADLTKEVVVLGRSEAVDAELVAQRGTVTMLGSGDMKSQLQLRFGLGVETKDDAGRLFPDVTMARELYRFAKDERYRGVFLMKAPGHKSVLPVKGYWVAPGDISGLALSLAPYRPDLEQDCAEHVHQVLLGLGAAGGFYGRWDRLARDLGETHRPQDVPAAPVSPVPSGGDTGDGTRPMSRAERMGLPESPLIAKIRADRDKRKGQETGQEAGHDGAESQPAARDMSPAELEALFNAPAAEGSHVPADEAARVVPAILTTLANIFEARDAERLHTRQILLELPGGGEDSTRMTAKAFGLLMGQCGVAPLPNDFPVDGERGRGYALADVKRALTAYRDGARKAGGPEFDWPDPQ